MGIHDRHYVREDSGGGGGRGPGGGGGGPLGFLNTSFPVGRYLGIRVRVHITFLILLVFWLVTGRNPIDTLIWVGVLFGSVLLHEFGHCLGCRAVGGQANDILMWPLGGLAYCRPPRRPWPEFVTVACGPLVNVVLAGIAVAILVAMNGSALPISFHPLQAGLGPGVSSGMFEWFVNFVFVVNYILLLFNLALVFYPFDGGRLVQIALWKFVGYVRSMRLATSLGIVGAAIIALLGLTSGITMLVVIALFGGFTCYQQLQQLRGLDDWAIPDEPDLRRGPAKPSFLQRKQAERRDQRAQRDAAAQRRIEEEVDRILDKVHTHGLTSLTTAEKRTLEQGTQRARGR
ncbi:MAG: hypothetical protein KDA25_03840 [Phycisphaerales bacterium]|nr:hypothetical protein [Phycisphaerales bacterium]